MKKPPLGVMPAHLWWQDHPDPSLQELVDRYREVGEAVERYRKAGLEPLRLWILELGAHPAIWDRPTTRIIVVPT